MKNVSTAVKATKRKIEWDFIEADWRAGVKSKQQMSMEHGVSRAAMDKRFAKMGVERDLEEKIRAKAEALVARSVVTRSVTPQSGAVTEKEIVDGNADQRANLNLCHRKDAQRTRKVGMTLLAELEFQNENLELLDQLRELMLDPDEKGQDKRDELLRKVISLPSRASTFKTLTDSLKTAISLEREAFGLDAKDSADSGIESVIKRVMKKNGES